MPLEVIAVEIRDANFTGFMIRIYIINEEVPRMHISKRSEQELSDRMVGKLSHVVLFIERKQISAAGDKSVNIIHHGFQSPEILTGFNCDRLSKLF